MSIRTRKMETNSDVCLYVDMPARRDETNFRSVMEFRVLDPPEGSPCCRFPIAALVSPYGREGRFAISGSAAMQSMCFNRRVKWALFTQICL